MVKIKDILNTYKQIDDKSIEPSRKRLFHAACKTVLGENLYQRNKIDMEAPYGGLIGMNNSFLESFLKYSKTMRVHAALHDAFGFCKTNYDKGPGYSYVIPLPWNSCLLGHLTGILYVVYIRLRHFGLFEDV